MKKLWHKLTHILNGFTHNDLEIVRMEKNPMQDVVIYFRCAKCGKLPAYKWNWSVK